MTANTRMTDEWITRVWKDNPCVEIENGEIRTGPIRLAFANILERQKDKGGKERGYGAVLLFPDLALIGGREPLKPLFDAYTALFTEEAPQALQNPALRAKFHNPFKKQDDFIDMKTGGLYQGFVEGRMCISANSPQTQPQACDTTRAPIVDKRRLYSGCWAFATVKPSWIKREDKKGPTFYLQSVMVIADDNSLGGLAGGAPPAVAYAGVKIDPVVNPASAFNDDPLAGDDIPY